MKAKTITGVAAAAALCMTAAFAVQDGNTQETSFTPTPEAMAAMMPGPMHAHLKPFAGSWDVTLKYRMGPDEPWAANALTAERELILDGRFLTEVIRGDWLGTPFEGHALIGHDNVRGEYTYVWYDNMSTGTAISTGMADDSGKKLTFEGTSSDPWTGEKEKWMKSILSLADEDTSLFEMHMKGPDGNPFMSMTIEYKRK